MNVVLFLVFGAVYFGTGIWGVVWVNRRIPNPLLLPYNGWAGTIIDLPFRLFVSIIAFLVASAPAFLLAEFLGRVLHVGAS
ncbi:MAG TPA: hypothetical protein VFX19_04790 [Dehalococcoidia bacterium]|nr:hypothetical protein [Dehalococcoidia bacterium]